MRLSIRHIFNTGKRFKKDNISFFTLVLYMEKYKIIF